MKFSNEVVIDYTNWKGIRRSRKILPMTMSLGSTQYHEDEQWLLEAMDVEDNNIVKSFAMKDVHSWTPVLLDPSRLKMVDKWPFKGGSNAGT